MHMRVKPFALPELSVCPYYVIRPEEFRGRWRERLGMRQPLYVELGCGKAVSTAQMAHDHPECRYLAIDMSPDILGVARRNIAQVYGAESVRNLLLIRWNIDYIDEILSEEDRVDRIYIHFCNPWTQRAKHAKRRLTSPQKLMLYRQFLKDGGEIYFKTDNDALFADSLAYFEAFGFETVYLTDDLHASEFQPNYESEHEKLYAGQGIPIKFVIVKKVPLKEEPDPKKWLLARGASMRDR